MTRNSFLFVVLFWNQCIKYELLSYIHTVTYVIEKILSLSKVSTKPTYYIKKGLNFLFGFPPRSPSLLCSIFKIQILEMSLKTSNLSADDDYSSTTSTSMYIVHIMYLLFFCMCIKIESRHEP